jgi:hypothetical protein
MWWVKDVEKTENVAREVKNAPSFTSEFLAQIFLAVNCPTDLSGHFLNEQLKKSYSDLLGYNVFVVQ